MALMQHDLIPPTDAALNQAAVSVPVDQIRLQAVRDAIERMIELSAGKGKSKEDSRQMVGLAAPQIGVNKRIITIDSTADGSNKQQNLVAVINPHIIYSSKNTVVGREGCWSCGNICGIVERAEEVTLEGLDRNGSPLNLSLTGFVARIAQHEVDHLDGVRFPDRVPVGRPDRLHWVEPKEFERYRNEWQNWPHKCPRERWEHMKRGLNGGDNVS